MSDELPEGWATCTLDQLLQLGGLFDGPFGSSLKTSDYAECGVRVIRLENIANLRFVSEKETWVPKAKFEELKRHSVHEGDIIFGSFLDDAVRVCLLPRLSTPAIAKADCFCVRPRADLVDPKFLVYQLGSSSTRDALVEQIHGATRPRINTGQLRALEIVLPPLAEQRRIAAKIEALLARVNAARERLEKVPLLLKRFRQSVLAKACGGELVSTDAELASGGAVETTNELPEGWASRSLGEISDLVSGAGFPLEHQQKPGLPLPFFKVGNLGEVESGQPLLLSDHTVSEELAQDLKARVIPQGSVVFAKIGMAIRLNRRRPLGKPACIDNNMMAAIPGPAISPRYLLRFLETVDLMPMTQSTTVPSLRKSDLAALEVPLPSLAEQRRIVAKLEKLLAAADSLERAVYHTRGQLLMAPRAILENAFAGELVSREADLAREEGRPFESAEDLLALTKGETTEPDRLRGAAKSTGRRAKVA